MKELSIQEKAAAYDKAVEKIKYVMEHGVSPVLNKKDLQDIFPQLKESEDEKIRKTLIEYFNAYPKDYYGELKTSSILAWLEKQDRKDVVDINPSEFESRLNALLKQFEKLPKEELASSLSFYLNIVQNDGTYKDEEKQSEQEDQQKLFDIAKHQGYKEGLRDGRAEVWAQIEKQGEQKLFDYENVNIKQKDFAPKSALEAIKEEKVNNANKVEPKFKIGDWAVSPNGVYWHIDAIRNDRYQVSSDSGGSAEWPLDTNIYHKFTIQDAKDGDVLVASDDSIFIFKEVVNNGCKYYIALTTDKVVDVNIRLKYCWETAKGAKPAIKEQRDLLFSKMKEAGYTFDFNKKELKKIEQKPVYHKFRVGDEIKTINEEPITITKIDDKGYWSNDLFICNFDDEVCWDMVEQKPITPKFNVGDTIKCTYDNRQFTIKSVDIEKGIYTYTEDGCSNDIDYVDEEFELVKHKPVEWSEEDDYMLESIISDFAAGLSSTIGQDKWLKSLRPQKQWKPTEEQTDALLFAEGFVRGHCAEEIAKELSSLYEQLKAL